MAFIPGNNGSPSNPLDGLRGVTSGVDAASGIVGEYVESKVLIGSAVALTTATQITLVSLALQPGDWDLSGFIHYEGTATSVNERLAEICPTAATFGTGDRGRAQLGVTANLTVTSEYWAIPTLRQNISVATTYFLVVRATFTGGTCLTAGRLSARRIR